LDRAGDKRLMVFVLLYIPCVLTVAWIASLITYRLSLMLG
jgi:Fe2+ transport system protein B